MKSLCRNTVNESLPDFQSVWNASRCLGHRDFLHQSAVPVLVSPYCLSRRPSLEVSWPGNWLLPLLNAHAALQSSCLRPGNYWTGGAGLLLTAGLPSLLPQHVALRCVERMSEQQKNASYWSRGNLQSCCKASASLCGTAVLEEHIERSTDVRQMHPFLFPLLKVVMSPLLWPVGLWQW